MILSTMNHLPGLHAQERLVEAAQAKGGDAVLAMRFDASEFQAGQEICAYGTAVKIRPADSYR